jgi:hypothetical protein
VAGMSAWSCLLPFAASVGVVIFVVPLALELLGLTLQPPRALDCRCTGFPVLGLFAGLGDRPVGRRWDARLIVRVRHCAQPSWQA